MPHLANEPFVRIWRSRSLASISRGKSCLPGTNTIDVQREARPKSNDETMLTDARSNTTSLLGSCLAMSFTLHCSCNPCSIVPFDTPNSSALAVLLSACLSNGLFHCKRYYTKRMSPRSLIVAFHAMGCFGSCDPFFHLLARKKKGSRPKAFAWMRGAFTYESCTCALRAKLSSFNVAIMNV